MVLEREGGGGEGGETLPNASYSSIILDVECSKLRNKRRTDIL